jgi:alpha-L-fucosidase
VIHKLGTVDCDMVETTPVVFHGRLYRFEYVRVGYHANATGASYFRFIDVETGRPTPSFAVGYHLGSAYVHDGVVYVYGVPAWGGAEIRGFWSRDLAKWSSQPAISLPGWGIYNTSVCAGPKRYAMAFEIGEPPEEVGVRFTMRFAESRDLLNWTLTPSDRVFSRDRYTACPALRFLDGRFYMIYLEARPGPTYEPHIVRSKDLVNWESSPLNPVMQFSPEDKNIANPSLTPELRARIAGAVNRNNSDVDLCEFRGQVVIYYSWGNQQGIEFLAEAVYDGSLRDFLLGFFPQS